MVLKVCRCISLGVSSGLMWVAIAHGQTVNHPASTSGTGSDSATAAPGARGESLTYGADVGIGESDNVTLVHTDKVSQTIAITDLNIDFKDQTRRFDVDAKGDFSYLDYLQNAYGNQLIGRFDGRADVALIPERVSWVLTESFGQSQIDPFIAAVPTNLQNINYVATGPDANFRLGPTVFLDLSARYAKTTYQTDPFDSNAVNASAALGRALSAQSSISLNGSFERMLFDNTDVNTDFNRSSVYAHYEVQGARTNLTANLGATKVDQGSQSFTGPDAKLQLLRKLSSVSTLTLTIGRDITDGSTAFANLQSGAIGGIVTGPAVLSQSNYTATFGTVAWEYARNRTTIGVSGNWEKDAYEGQPSQNVTRSTAEVRVERKLSRVLTAQLLGRLYRNEYENTDFSETDGVVGAALMFHSGRGLEIKLRYDHSSRSVSGVGVVPGVSSGYDENRAFLTIGYRPRTAQST
jgi:Putative beta-barrel porin 2